MRQAGSSEAGGSRRQLSVFDRTRDGHDPCAYASIRGYILGSRIESVIGQSYRGALLGVAVTSLVTLVGVVIFEWSLAVLLLAYWVEAVAAGVLTVPRIRLSGGPIDDGTSGVEAYEVPLGEWAARKRKPRRAVARWFAFAYGLALALVSVIVLLLVVVFAAAETPAVATVIIAVVVATLGPIASFVVEYGRGDLATASAAHLVNDAFAGVGVLVLTIVGGLLLGVVVGTGVGVLIAFVVVRGLVEWGTLHRRLRKEHVNPGADEPDGSSDA
jgi:hypothetical protein